METVRTRMQGVQPLEAVPEPEEQRRLLRAAGLTDDDTGVLCEVSGRTVRRWRTGRCLPRGFTSLRYRRLLAALSEHR